MVSKQEVKIAYSSVEEVVDIWKKRLGEDWVNDAFAQPNLEQKVAALAQRAQCSLPEAWSSYFSGVMLSQI